MSKYKNIDIFSIILIILLIFFTIFRIQNSLISGFMDDEPETLYNAKEIYHGKLPSVDYFEHHPVIPYILLAPFSDISIWQYQRVLMAILSIIGGIVLYYFFLNIGFDRKITILTISSFLVSPLLNRMAIMIIPDSFMVFFFIIGLYFYSRILKNNRNIDFLLLGLFWSLSILSKIGSIIPIIFFTLFIIYRFKEKIGKNIFYLFIGYTIPVVIIFIVYRLNFEYFNYMIDGILVNMYVKKIYSQSIYDRLEILAGQIISMYIYLWIVGTIGSILYLKLNFEQNHGLKDNRIVIILLSTISFFLLIYYNLNMTVAGWPQYYMMNIVLLSMMLPGFYILSQKYWNNIDYRKHNLMYTTIFLIFIFFAFIQPFIMSTYIFQPNNHKEEQILVEWLNNNTDRNRYVFENWVYFNYLADLKFDYKVPIFSDVTFYYLTTTKNNFVTDEMYLKKNIYENQDYDTVLFHGPIFDDLFFWIEKQFDKEGWYLAKRYNIEKYDYNDQILFWYPGFKTKTFDFQIDIWKRKKENYTEKNIEFKLPEDKTSSLLLSDIDIEKWKK